MGSECNLEVSMEKLSSMIDDPQDDNVSEMSESEKQILLQSEAEYKEYIEYQEYQELIRIKIAN
jgi:hypothetical protein